MNKATNIVELELRLIQIRSISPNPSFTEKLQQHVFSPPIIDCCPIHISFFITFARPKTEKMDLLTDIKDIPAPDPRKWFVVYTRAKAEKKTHAELISLGIEAYLPLRKTLNQWKDRKKLVEVPLISSYVFVKVKPNEKDLVFRCNHVVKFISFEGKPVAVPEKQMVSLKCLVNADVPLEVVIENINPGENVKIIYGPMAGVTGEFVSIDSEKRFLLRINNIGYSLVAKIPAAWVEKA